MLVNHLCAHDGQKKILDPLDLELQAAVNHHTGAENRARVLCKRHWESSTSERSPLPSPSLELILILSAAVTHTRRARSSSKYSLGLSWLEESKHVILVILPGGSTCVSPVTCDSRVTL